MFSVTTGVLANRHLWAALAAWAIAQALKVLTSIRRGHRLDWSKLVGPGGMPSSHSAFVTGLAISIGITEGWNSPGFAMALVFAMVVMYDAAGVRRAAGKQARVLNQLVDAMFDEGHVPFGKLRELLGHTPLEVVAGAILGAVTAWYLLGR